MHTQVRRYEGGALGLPAHGRFIAITNTELGRLACDRRYLLSNIEHLVAPPTKRMDLGNVWHAVTEEIYVWWQLNDAKYPESGLDSCVWCDGHAHDDDAGVDCEHCGGTGQSALARAMAPYYAALDEYEGDEGDVPGAAPIYTREEVEKLEETVRRMATSYLVRYHNGPLQSIRIVAVEVPIARAILNPRTGRPFRSQVVLERVPDMEHEIWRLASSGALHRLPAEDIKKVSWPWYLVGRLDVVGADRQTNAGWVIDTKSATDIKKYERTMQYDPQLPGYCWMLEGHLEHFGLDGIAGFMYDVTNSKWQPDPQELQWKPPKVDEMKELAAARGLDTKGCKKSEDFMALLGIEAGHGGFSQSKTAGVPSYRYERALRAAGLDFGPYEEHLDFLADSVDKTLHDRPWLTFGDERRARYEREVFAKASLIAALRKSAASLPVSPEGTPDVVEADLRFPREPICTGPGAKCLYAEPCVLDTPEARSGYDLSPGQRWGTDPAALVAAPTVQDDDPPDMEW